MARIKHKPNYSTRQKNDFINKFIASGKSKAGFCQQHSISESALYRWLHKYKNSESTAELKLVPISVNKQPEHIIEFHQEQLLIINFGEQITLRIPNFKLQRFLALLPGLLSC